MIGLKKLIGAGFGSGFSPVAPGTIGSFFALIPAYFVVWIHPLLAPIILSVIFSALSLWVANTCINAWGDDPGKMVMDEFAGQSLVFIGLPIHRSIEDWWLVLAAFIFFRLFDILKPMGINKLQQLKNGWGILLDDLLAGFYALICLKTLIFLLKTYEIAVLHEN